MMQHFWDFIWVFTIYRSTRYWAVRGIKQTKGKADPCSLVSPVLMCFTGLDKQKNSA